MSESDGSRHSDSDHGGSDSEGERGGRGTKHSRARQYSDEAEEARSGDEEQSGDEEPADGEDIAQSERDSEEDEEDEDRPRKKKRRNAVADYFLVEAEVDDPDGEEEDDDEVNYDLLGNERDEVGVTAREIEASRRASNIWDNEKEEEIEEYYRRKYAEETSAGARFGVGGEDMSDEITQQTLLPGVKDPNLWMVKCRIGEEKATALQMMRKYIAYQHTEEPLQIKSLVAPEGVKGYVYIESFKQSHVKQAVEGVSNLRIGLWTQTMVPIQQMTDVLRVVKSVPSLKKNVWVRLRRGIFKEDLAQVDYVDSSQNNVMLKLIPRIDYTKKRGLLKTSQGDDKRKKTPRPPQKLFDNVAIQAIGGLVTQDGDFLVFEGNRYTRKGFLYKQFNMSAIMFEGVKPTLAELEKFEEQNLTDVELTTASTDEESHNFAPGDNVEVVEGELVNLMGKVTRVDGARIYIKPNHEDLKDDLEFFAHELKKYFRQGDHVKVIAGRYEGDTGLIVRVEENLIVLFSDLTMHELQVLPRDLQLCADVATGVDSLGQFQWGDMVAIDSQTVGVIVRLEKESFQVLTMHGKIQYVRPQAVHKKKENRRAMALDSEQNTIQINDIVKAVDGPYTGEHGEMKHLYRNYAFLYNKTQLENGGIFVCKTRHLLLAGGGKGSSGVGGPMGGVGGLGFMSPRLTSPAHSGSASERSGGFGAGGGGGDRGGGRGRGRGRGVGRDRGLIGVTIKITQGPYKGHVGIVKDATDCTVRVELHSKCQTIIVDRSRVAPVGSTSTRSAGSFTASHTPQWGSQTPMYGVAGGAHTPMYGSQTPQYDGSRTPNFGSMTPSHEPGSQTPGRQSAWDPNITNTPARSSDFDEYSYDEATPSPAYNPGGGAGGNTPGYQSDVGQGPYTPATPGAAYNSDNNYSPYNQPDPSPQAYQPGSSPSAYAGTPSPAGTGAYQATPSPGGSGYASPSPLAYSPMTPGAASPYTGSTGVDSLGMQDWQSVDIEVKIRATHDDPGLSGQVGVIRSITGGNCSVFLPEEERVVNINGEHLEPVVPVQGDRVKVIFGEDREQMGSLLSIDNNEGVVNMDHSDLKMLQLRYLCKMSSQQQ
ncbi:hypothetical protein HAZT_HAZT006833 [Hyalella azteca]|uniref:Transcription elongation factor SPT5 n=1 Tax=Hyalella azteca TaxID=294128 RepID=A0A6A0GYX0_HYAAZ|nr:hypothetical protein HAZT_HAZT006833 [Hyalella azteca]